MFYRALVLGVVGAEDFFAFLVEVISALYLFVFVAVGY